MSKIQYIKSEGYAARAEGRNAWADWMADEDFDLHITLNFNKPTPPHGARKKFKNLLGHLDNHFFGRSWSKQGDRRTFAFAFGEHPQSNLHLHVLARLPAEGRYLPTRSQAKIISKYWKKLVPSGDAAVTPITDGGAARYVTKHLARIGHEDLIFISTEFHR